MFHITETTVTLNLDFQQNNSHINTILQQKAMEYRNSNSNYSDTIQRNSNFNYQQTDTIRVAFVTIKKITEDIRPCSVGWQTCQRQSAILFSTGFSAAHNGADWKAIKIWNHLIFFCKSAAGNKTCVLQKSLEQGAPQPFTAWFICIFSS